MKTWGTTVLVLLITLPIASAGEPESPAYPKPPNPAFIAKQLHVETGAIKATLQPVKGQDVAAPKSEKVLWATSYRIQSSPGFSLSIMLVRSGMIKIERIEGLADHPELEFQKLVQSNGDIIYQTLTDRGDAGTCYATQLISHQKDWDLIIGLGVDPGANEKGAPVDISKDGIALIRGINRYLRGK